jgi:hypothetical protein
MLAFPALRFFAGIAREDNVNLKYKLIDDQVVPCDDLLEWARWYEDPKNRIIIKTKHGSTEISTIFLGIACGIDDMGRPILFETLILDGENIEYCAQYSTVRQARLGHWLALLKHYWIPYT